MIEAKVFDKTKDGRQVLAFTLTDGKSYVKVLNYGGIIQSLVVPDKDGNPTDVVLGYKNIEGYEKNDGYLGALIGRFGNRIRKGDLPIDGNHYLLYCNDKGNHLHGGKVGFDKKIWKPEINGDELTLSIVSPDGEENYPGNLEVRVTYTFKNGELKIQYYAVSDKKTAINLTNHAYFNLSGEGSGDATDNEMWIDSDYITSTDENLIPMGGFRAVEGTPFDFNKPKAIGQDIDADDEDLKKGGGYDHCHLLKNKSGEYVKYAQAYSSKTGIKMSCYTDMPAVHFYAGNCLNQKGKTIYYGKRAGYCLETEAIPNNVNVPEYAVLGSSIYNAGQKYCFSAAYKFEVYQIISAFASWLKIAPMRIQFKSVTKKADLDRHISILQEELREEDNEHCRELGKDYIGLIQEVGNREALTRRFFLIFEYESPHRAFDDFALVYSTMQTVEQNARAYFSQCGNSILQHQNEDEATAEILYMYFNRCSCIEEPFSQRVERIVVDAVRGEGGILGLDPVPAIPISAFVAPRGIDFTHANYFVMDGLYYSILYIRADGYPSSVRAGWMSAIINAGEGIDVDVHLRKENRSKVIDKVAQRIRLNNVGEKHDTVLRLTGFTRGVAFVNGVNLGRHWAAENSCNKLFVPAPFLKEGENELVIFDVLANANGKTVTLTDDTSD